MADFSIPIVYCAAGSTAVARLRSPDGATVLATLTLTPASSGSTSYSGTVTISPTPPDSAMPYLWDVTMTNGASSRQAVAVGTIYGYLVGGVWYDPTSPGAVAAAVLASLHGYGPYSLAVHVQDATSGAAIVGASVAVQGGAASGVTDSSGSTSLAVSPSTVNLVVIAPGYIGAIRSVVVTASGAVVVALTAYGVIPSTLNGQTNAYGYLYDGAGNPNVGGEVTFRLIDPLGNVGTFDRTNFTVVSSLGGLLQTPLIKAARYQAKAPKGDWIDFTTGSDSTYQLPVLTSGQGN